VKAEREKEGAAPPEPAPAPAEEEKRPCDKATADTESTTNRGKEVTEKVDNRKLVYEDIWDEPPPLEQQPSSIASSRAAAAAEAEDGTADFFEPAETFQGARPGLVFKTGSRGLGYYRDALQAASAGDSTGSSAAAKEPADVFLPWASGTGGLDDLPVPTAAVERRMAELRAAKEEQKQKGQAAPEATAPKGASWYTKYAEKKQEVEAHLEKTKATFAPPARRPGGAGISEVTLAAPEAVPAAAEAPTPAPSSAKATTTTKAADPAEGADDLRRK